MTKEMVDKKSQTLIENEKTVEELKIENANLKNQLSQKDHDKEILETKIDELIREIAQNREIIDKINANKAYKSTHATFEKLMEENTKLNTTIKPLKKKISDLESEIKTLNEIVKSIESDYSKLEQQSDSYKSSIVNLEQEKTQIKETSSKKIAEIQGKKVKKAKKKEDSKVTEEFKPDGRIAAKDKIVEGTSRRKCPICGNSNTHLIREVTDKSIIILDYPKVYGKKFVCGECGQSWRVKKE